MTTNKMHFIVLLCLIQLGVFEALEKIVDESLESVNAKNNLPLISQNESNKNLSAIPQNVNTKNLTAISQNVNNTATSLNNTTINNVANRRSVLTNLDKEAAMKALALAFSGLVKIAFDQVPMGGTMYDFIEGLYDHMQTEQRSLWQQIRFQVQDSIDKSNVDMDLDDVDRKLAIVERRIKEDDLEDDDYRIAIDLIEIVFPHKRESVPWSDELPLRTLYFIPLIIQVYQLRIDHGKEKDKCSLGKRLVEIRQEVILGMKEMIRKRYRQVRDDDYLDWGGGKGTVSYKAGQNTFNISILEKGKVKTTEPECSKYLVGQNTCWDLVLYSWKHQIEKIESNVEDFLMKVVVNKINKFFDQDICFQGCPCPTPIKKKEIKLPWPSDCLDKYNRCQHMCGEFDSNYNWCWRKDSFRPSKKWIKCTPIDIRCCIKLPYDSNPTRCTNSKKMVKKRKTSIKRKGIL